MFCTRLSIVLRICTSRCGCRPIRLNMPASTPRTLEPGAPYEVNLTDRNRSELLQLTAASTPPPSVYEAARKEIQWILEDSLTRWEKRALSNAGWRRLAFSTYVGLFNACLTVVAMVIARLYVRGNSGRIIAACLTPWLWFAIVGVICGLKGVCFLCYSAGGTVRQVSSFELALPQTSTARAFGTSTHSASLASLARPASTYNGDRNPYKKTDPDDPFSPHSARGSEVVVRPVPNMRNRRTEASKEKIVKLWAPMVAVEDPLVVRAHWESVISGCFWSLLLAVPMGVIAAAV